MSQHRTEKRDLSFFRRKWNDYVETGSTNVLLEGHNRGDFLEELEKSNPSE